MAAHDRAPQHRGCDRLDLDDKIAGSNGDNKINGGKGNDSISGGGGNDELIGGEGHDVIDGGSGDDMISGGTGRNTLSGGTGNDTIELTFDATGLAGDLDLINGGADVDTLTFARTESFGVTVVLGHEQLANQPGTVRSVLFTGEDIQEVFASYLEANISLIENVTGTRQRDFIQGNNGDNTILGMDGNDTLVPGGGRDLVDGGAGDDFIESFGDGVLDEIFGGEGIDTVSFRDYSTSEVRSLAVGLGEVGEAGLAYRRYAEANGEIWVLEDELHDIENIIGDAGDDTLVGNSGDNMIDGSDGNDEIVGGSGNDTLIGGNGRDNLEGNDGQDTFRFDVGEIGDLADHIVDFETGVDRIQVTFSDAPPTFLGDAPFTGAGGELRIVIDAGQSLIQFDRFGGGINSSDDLEIHVTGKVAFSDLLFGWGSP